MAFKQLLTDFLIRLEDMNHLTPLLPTYELIIKFVYEESYIFLVLSNKGSRLAAECYDSEAVTIEGTTGLENLLDGSKKLGKLVSEGEIEITATYRNTLLLESVFFLCRNRDEEKMIS